MTVAPILSLCAEKQLLLDLLDGKVVDPDAGRQKHDDGGESGSAREFADSSLVVAFFMCFLCPTALRLVSANTSSS